MTDLKNVFNRKNYQRGNQTAFALFISKNKSTEPITLHLDSATQLTHTLYRLVTIAH